MSPIYCFDFAFFAISYITSVCRQIRKYFKAYFFVLCFTQAVSSPSCPKGKQE